MPRVHCLHRPRRIASALLFVWLFATVASWANACLVQPSGATAHARDHHARIGAGRPLGGEHHAAVQAGGTGEPDPARQACASFCETEQSIVAKAQATKGDGGADAAVPLLAAFGGRTTSMLGQTEPHWRPLAAPPPPGPPVAIAFLRLTL